MPSYGPRSELTSGSGSRVPLGSAALAVLVGLAFGVGILAQPAERERTLTAELAPSIDPSSLRSAQLRLDGQNRRVLAVEPAGSSPVVLWLDLPLSTSTTVEQWTAILAERASELVGLGPVTVVLGGLEPEMFEGPTRDAASLREALEEIAADSTVWRELGELEEIREELEAAAGEGDRGAVLDLLRSERRLVRQQWDTLLDARARLGLDTAGGAGVLLLVQDAIHVPPLDVIEDEALRAEVEARAPEAFDLALRELGRTLSAEGWAVFPLLPPGGDEGSDSPFGARPIAEPSGGIEIGSAETLDRTMVDLGRRVRVTYVVSETLLEAKPVDLTLAAADGVPIAPLRWRRWATSATPDAALRARARSALAAGDAIGDFEVVAALSDGERTIEASIDLEPASPSEGSGRQLRATLLFDTLDLGTPTVQAVGTAQTTRQNNRLRLVTSIDPPEEMDRALLLIDDLTTDEWGVAEIEIGEPPPDREPGEIDLALRFPTSDDRVGASEAARVGEDPSLIEIVPPRGSNFSGEVRITVLNTSEAVRSVRFFLDGTEVDSDQRPPYQTRVDLGEEVVPHEVRAVAYSVSGLELDQDTLVLNGTPRQRGVRITSGTRDGTILLRADLDEDDDRAALDRVEIYRNQERLATFTRPPYEVSLAGTVIRPGDFARAVAILDDGTELEDVLFLGGSSDRVEVNLVQVFAVVTDREGDPVLGLGPEDFRLRRDKQDQPIESFAVADEVPLQLGLTIDTSGSMSYIMADTRIAAVQFLADVVTPIDQAFIVDFDDRPRLMQGLTGDISELVRALGAIEADGFTALYDSLLFSLQQFGDSRGRRSIVLLSDGDDFQSRFGWRRTYLTVRDAAVPVYILALAGLDPERPGFRKADLETLAEDTSGRVFYIESLQDVTEAYRQITAELRSQYVLGFTTEGALPAEELRKIELEVLDRKYEVRSVVGQAGQ